MATKVAVRATPSASLKPGTIALAAAGVAATAGVLYFLGIGERGERNRQKVKSWAVKARADVLERLEELKNIDAEEYGRIVNSVIHRDLRRSSDDE